MDLRERKEFEARVPEIIYTAIFIGLAIFLILLFFFMFLWDSLFVTAYENLRANMTGGIVKTGLRHYNGS